jgi:tetratricopeptide (TPR) repeat protein
MTMKKSLLIYLAFLAPLICGFDWTFGLAGKCSQAKKIVAVLAEKKNDLERDQNEKRVLALCPDGAPGHFVRALRYERAERPDDAIAEYQECLKDEPDFPKAGGNLGLLHFRKGMLDEAALELTKALATDRDPRYLKGLAGIYADKKMYPMALYHYEEAHKAAPNDESILVSIADIHRKQGQLEQAGQGYFKVLSINSANEEARLGMAALYLDTNRVDKALDELKRMQTVNPQNRKIHLLLAEAYERKGDLKSAEYEYLLGGRTRSVELMEQLRKGNKYLQAGDYYKAVNELETALKEKPGDLQTLRKLGDVYMAAGRDEEAVSTYREAIRMKGGNAAVHRSLGVLYEKKGLLDEAVVEYREAIRYDSTDAESRRLLADIYSLRGSYPQAIEQYRELVRMQKDTPQVHLRLARAYANNKNPREALSEYLATVKLEPDNVEAQRELANLYRRNSMDDEAEKRFREVLRIRKDDAESRNALLAIYVKKKKYDEVIALLKENVELAPADPVNHYKLGLIYEFSKDYDAAVDAYKKAVDLKGDSAKTLNALGRVYMKTGRFAEARETLEAAKQADPNLEETNVLLGNIRDEISPEPQVYRKKSYAKSKGKKGKREKYVGKKKSKKSAGKDYRKPGKGDSKQKLTKGGKSKKASGGGKAKKSSKGKKKK